MRRIPTVQYCVSQQTESLNRSEMDKTRADDSEMKLSSPLVDLVAYVTKLENENQHLKKLCETYVNEKVGYNCWNIFNLACN